MANHHMGSLKVRRKLRTLRQRDGELCWVCKEPIPPDAPPNDPSRASLDHVVPKRDGGGNENANLRLAHGRCNLERTLENKS